MTWRTDASCADLPPDMFIPERADNTYVVELCRSCPSFLPCIDSALAEDLMCLNGTGIYAGTTPAERRMLRRRARAVAVQPRSGTPNNHNQETAA